MSISEKICGIYNDFLYEGANSGRAYLEARIAAGKECCSIEWEDDPNEGDCPSITFTFLDGSSCYISYSDCRE